MGDAGQKGALGGDLGVERRHCMGGRVSREGCEIWRYRTGAEPSRTVATLSSMRTGKLAVSRSEQRD
jgi:hypothetical protein